MTGIEAIAAVGAGQSDPVAMQIGQATQPIASPSVGGADFAQVLMNGLHGVDAKVAAADKLVQQFALDDSVPVHQVTMALAEARVSVELAMQVRGRLVEAYRDIMNMQL
ncbi:flagellar hook-basal body complex protein FliE [Sphingomonas sp.]|uniref:flagellar hook-basal body complex protein FliE n=1 Tax=Sphingomonas sp. TaxID=28214 RepID=UPI001AFE3F2E|nr:flagellar hook-basal body complex protein FliE [Sphingomonas sp.]MBO9714796.1 flagellar hook-basal body complex protein FliE [Sphingomonas sp.]